MSSVDHFCKQPCVSVIILNSHPMRCALEILKSIFAKSLTIDFYKDRLIIRHSAEDKRSHCKIEIEKSKLFFYSFTPFEVDGVTPVRLSVTVEADSFMQSVKNEKKQDSCFSVLCSYNTVSSIIVFSQERSGSVVEDQPSIYSFCFEEEVDLDDPYANVYCDYDENSTLTEKDIESNIGRYKTVSCQSVNARLKETGVINLSARTRTGKDVRIDLPSLYATTEQEETTGGGKAEAAQDDYLINLRGKDLDLILKLKKLGTSNVIRIYMSMDYPLLFHTLISNFGTFILWFVNPV